MIRVRTLVIAAAVAFGVAGTASLASANPPCGGPFCNQPKYPTLSHYLFKTNNQPLPVFQAAPWYLYWPYDAHFLTPAPVHGAFNGPPGVGGYANPYFPHPGSMGYGPIPGGPPPATIRP